MKKIITDADTDMAYFSKILTYYKCWSDIKNNLEIHEINWGLIENTRDLWVRDFMPIQCHGDKMVQFRYAPSYLTGKEKYLSKPEECTKSINYDITYCDLKLDGGNVIKCDDCVIISERIFIENETLSKSEIVNKIEDALETEVVLVPDDECEMCGHADGMIRYIGENKVLLNHYIDFDKKLEKRLKNAISERFDVHELHFETKELLSTSWAYLNYMQIGDYIFMPAFKNKLDENAMKQLECATGKRVYPIYCPSTVKIGGGLNCMSWTVKSKK